MKFTKIVLLVASVQAAAKTEGYECTKGVDTCTADVAANDSACCNLMSTLLTTIKTTMCVDKTSTSVKDKEGTASYGYNCNYGGATALVASFATTASAIFMMQ